MKTLMKSASDVSAVIAAAVLENNVASPDSEFEDFAALFAVVCVDSMHQEEHSGVHDFSTTCASLLAGGLQTLLSAD